MDYVAKLIERTAAIAKNGAAEKTSSKEDITYKTPWVNYPILSPPATKTELQLVRMDHVPKRFFGVPMGVRVSCVQLYMRLTSLGDETSGEADYVALFTPETDETPPEIWLKKSKDPISFPGEDPQDILLASDTDEGYETHRMLEELERATAKTQ